MSLRTRLFLIFAIVVLPFVASAAYLHYTRYYSNKSSAIAQQSDIAELLARSVELFVERVVSTQRIAGQALTIAHWHEADAQRRYLTAVVGSTQAIENIAFASPSGTITEAVPGSLVGHSIAHTPYFDRIRRGAQWTVSSSVENTRTGKQGMIIATAIRDSAGNLAGVVVSSVSESRIGTVTKPIAGSEARLFVVDSQGRTVYASGQLKVPKSGLDFSHYQLVHRALAGHLASSGNFILPNGVATVGSVAPVPSLGWAAGAFVPRSQVLGPVVAGSVRDILITVGVVVLATVLALLLTRRVTEQVSALAETAEKLGQGNLHVRAAAPEIAELASLADTMNIMADSIQERDRAIRAALASERKSAREASALYNITSNLIGSLVLADRLQALASGMAALAGAEICVFYVAEEDRLLVGAVSGMGEAHVESYAERKIPYYRFTGPVGDALRSGTPAVVNAPDAELDMLTIGNTQSALILPVMSDTNLLGAAVIYTVGKSTEFSEDVIATETTLGQLACRAITEARTFEREQRIARVLQRTLLGRVPHNVGRVEIATGYFAIREEAEVGGDLYDVAALPGECLGLLIADVAGKGLRAATNTAMVKYLSEGFAYYNNDPSDVLPKVNNVVVGSIEAWTFTTAFFGVLNVATGELVYSNAGHPPPLLKRSGGEVEWLETTPGPPLGVKEGASYPSGSVVLNPGDIILLYTDGVIEARSGEEWFGNEKLQEVARSFSESPVEIVDLVYKTAKAFAGGHLQDDIALVAVKMHE